MPNVLEHMQCILHTMSRLRFVVHDLDFKKWSYCFDMSKRAIKRTCCVLKLVTLYLSENWSCVQDTLSCASKGILHNNIVQSSSQPLKADNLRENYILYDEGLNFRDLLDKCLEFVCKIPLLACALDLKAAARPSSRATIGYIVYKSWICDYFNFSCHWMLLYNIP